MKHTYTYDTNIQPTIIDKHTGNTLWLATDCSNHCGIQPSTWRTYVAAKRAPQPVSHLADNPLWDANQVTQWHAQRPGSPVKNAPQPKHAQKT